jgi:DNA repair exonuclease SbcCD ATPase subunit
MAEELTSVGNASAPPEGQVQTSEGTAPQTQTPTNGQAAKVNLFELDEFKGYQAQFNRTVSALQEEIKQLRAAQQQAAMSGMDDLERATFLLQEKDRELAELRQAMERQVVAQQRWQDITELSTLTGAPTNVLDKARSYEEAVKVAIQYMRDHGATAKEIREAKTEANKVDLGGGGAVTPEDREVTERRELLKRGDTKGLFLKILEG